MIRRRLFPLAVAVFATPVLAEPPTVVADIAPVQSLLAQVMAGVAEPGLIVEQGADPHAVQLRPSQARKIAGADLMVWVGPELEPWLADVAARLAPGHQLVLVDEPVTRLRSFAQAEADDDDHDDHGTDNDTDHDHDHGDIDPHVWLDPGNARAWLGVFAERLAALDPDNAATYRANAAGAGAAIDALEARLAATLAPHAGAEIVTFHAAFGYFTDRYPIDVVGSVRPGDASTPSAAAVDRLRTLVDAHGVRCGFAEPGHSPAMLEAIEGGTGLRIGTLDPTGVLQSPGPGHYAATLEAIADSIATCLSQD